jgi:hypothetical protein
MPLQGGDEAIMRRRNTDAMFNFAHLKKKLTIGSRIGPTSDSN